MTNFRTTLLSTAAMGLITFSAIGYASAADVEKKMAWSGYVNRLTIMGDDGEGHFISHSDNADVAGTRGRIKASAKTDAMEIGALIELGLTDGDMASQDSVGGEAFSVRHNAVYLKNSMGKITVGHTSHAGEAITNADVSGTGDAVTYSASPFNDVRFNDSSTVDGSRAAGSTVTAAHGGGYTTSRENGISYTTPKFNGFTAMVSHRTDESGAWGFKYGGNFNGVKLTAVYAFSNQGVATGVLKTAAIDSVSGGGIGIELPTGLNLTVNLREEDTNVANTDPDGKTMMVKLGYKMTGLTDLGGTNVALMYKKADDANTTGDDFVDVSLVFAQKLSDYGTTVYGGFSNLSYDTAATNFDDINGVFMGAKVAF